MGVGKFEKIKNKKGKKIFLCILLVILALVLTAMVVGVIYYKSVLNQINRFDEATATLSSEEMESILNDFAADENVEDAENAEDLENLENLETVPEDLGAVSDDEEVIDTSIINIMLIGQDTRSSGQRGRSDSMILVSINMEAKKLVMTSFLRDLYIEIPVDNNQIYKQRLNVAYVLGGMECLDATMYHNFGVEIDNNIEVDFSGFQTIVDAFGGVDIELTSSEAYYLTSNYSKWMFNAGLNHLNGEQALAYSRIRKIDGDFQRTERQRVVVSKLLEKVKSMGLSDMLVLAKKLIPLITTDMTDSEITDYIMKLAPMLPEMEIITQRVPVDGSYKHANAGTKEQPMSVITCDLATNRQYLRDTIGVTTED